MADVPDPEVFCARLLREFGGIRFVNRIANQLSDNLSKLNDGLWTEIDAQLRELQRNSTKDMERKVANFLRTNLDGIGPKQSRNLLQLLGLARYEIPVDSRMLDWLTANGFPVPLSGPTLSDHNYYEFVLDGIIALCAHSGVEPSMFDAAVYASKEPD